VVRDERSTDGIDEPSLPHSKRIVEAKEADLRRAGDFLIMPPKGSRVLRFPPRRVCVACDTVLSIYNSTEYCSLHEPPRRTPIKRVP
jgi:hypothetical protein